MAYLVLTTAGLRELDMSDGDEWSALDVWRNATLAFIYSAFLEIILVKDFMAFYTFGNKPILFVNSWLCSKRVLFPNKNFTWSRIVS